MGSILGRSSEKPATNGLSDDMALAVSTWLNTTDFS
jgi:hypothetical protein